MRHLVPKMSCPFWLVPIKSHKAPFLHRPPLWSKADPGSRLLPPGGPLQRPATPGGGEGGGHRASKSDFHPTPTPTCSGCIFHTYLILFQMEGKK